jgi:putative flippase GtrA
LTTPTTPHVRAARKAATAWELLRFGVAGAVNAGVGYLAFAAFIYVGTPLYVAQALGHVIGTAFNYFSHSHFVFQRRPGLQRYLLSSGVNYLAGLIFLALCTRWIASPYVAGLVGTILTAAFSYLSLKLYAFRHRKNRG